MGLNPCTNPKLPFQQHTPAPHQLCQHPSHPKKRRKGSARKEPKDDPFIWRRGHHGTAGAPRNDAQSVCWRLWGGGRGALKTAHAVPWRCGAAAHAVRGCCCGRQDHGKFPGAAWPLPPAATAGGWGLLPPGGRAVRSGSGWGAVVPPVPVAPWPPRAGAIFPAAGRGPILPLPA